jgi:kinesin family protein 15
MFEIYNETISDLLEPSAQNLHVREDWQRGAFVEGLQEEPVTTWEQAYALLKRGSRQRATGETLMNAHSSRSHCVFTVDVQSRRTDPTSGLVTLKSSRLNLVDLAGSERQQLTAAAGARLKEAGQINKSLLTLANVIRSLVDIASGKERHVHFRDSKLTFLLRDSLGGNSKTSVVATVSPAEQSYGETLSTLMFA